jgi:hypothetical protein
MNKSPYKFLDSFTKDDRDIFFGRDREIEELYSRVYESKILLVYGTSGTGKSSLINCGLSNKFNDSDWLPVNVRRGNDINASLIEALSKNALTKTPFDRINPATQPYDLEKLLRSVYLDQFKPVFIIFDQFEELFIFGRKDEKERLIRNVAKVISSEIQCRFIFSLREEYLAGITEFEKVIPSFMGNRIRIEKMSRQNAVQTIEGPCRIKKIEIESGFAVNLLERLNPDSPEIELTWLQVYLDKLVRIATGKDQIITSLTNELIEKAGDVKDILGGFLEEQLSNLDDPEEGLTILKSFVSVKGTKNQITEDEIIEYTGLFGDSIRAERIKELIQRFISLRILKDKDENGKYELRHDSLASKIFEKITLVEKELLEVKFFIENSYEAYLKRQQLLSEDDLKYIAPYEDRLFLSERNQKFIAQSKRELHKTRRRRQNILAAVAAIVFVVLSFFTLWAMRERSNAIDQQIIAEDQRNAALKAKNEADISRQDAITSKKAAEENERIALEARNLSEAARKEAMVAKENALEQKARAEELSVIAKEQASNAERERKIANDQKLLAQTAEEKAKRMGFISLSQTLALKSVIMEKDPDLMGLLAVQAYNFNRENGGTTANPVIYEALEKSFTTLDSAKHSVLSGSKNEIRSLAPVSNGILSADMEGIIIRWQNDGTGIPVRRDVQPAFIGFIRISPDGSRLLTCYENNKIVLNNLSDVNEPGSETIRPGSQVRSAAWSADGSVLAIAAWDSTITFLESGSGKPTAYKTIKAPSGIRHCIFCSDNLLACALENGSVIAWNIENGSSTSLFISETDKPLCLAWNNYSKVLLAGCTNGTIVTLKTVSNNKVSVSRYVAHSSGIDQLVFNSDYSLLASAGWDRSIKLYNYHIYFELSDPVEGAIKLNGMNARARSLLFTGDNKLVASLSDRTIRVWETSSEKLVNLIRTLVRRDMTESEWSNMVGPDIPYEKTFNDLRTGGI